jgi:hypothetical protein
MFHRQEDGYPRNEVDDLANNIIQVIGDGKNAILVLNALADVICAVIESSIDDDEMKEKAVATVVSSIMMSLLTDEDLEDEPEILN